MNRQEFIKKWQRFVPWKEFETDLESVLSDQPDPKPEWISVKIKPNDRRMVDVTNGRKVTVGWYCAEHKRWLFECYPYFKRVLFWKERPTPPKK